jgi:hypothetical protein
VKRLLVLGGVLTVLASPALADMTPFQFKNVTTNNAVSAALGGQFQLEVGDVAGHSDQAVFRFMNAAGGAQSAIAQIYFYGGMALDILGFTTSGSGVAFKDVDSGFGHLPGLAPAEMSSLGLSVVDEADAKSPVTTKGVNPGEWLEVLVQLTPGKAYSDLIASMNTLHNGSSYANLFVGIHVQGFSQGSSESFITVANDEGGSQPSPAPVPAPGAVLLGMVGMSIISAVKRRWA